MDVSKKKLECAFDRYVAEIEAIGNITLSNDIEALDKVFHAHSNMVNIYNIGDIRWNSTQIQYMDEGITKAIDDMKNAWKKPAVNDLVHSHRLFIRGTIQIFNWAEKKNPIHFLTGKREIANILKEEMTKNPMVTRTHIAALNSWLSLLNQLIAFVRKHAKEVARIRREAEPYVMIEDGQFRMIVKFLQEMCTQEEIDSGVASPETLEKLNGMTQKQFKEMCVEVKQFLANDEN